MTSPRKRWNSHLGQLLTLRSANKSTDMASAQNSHSREVTILGSNYRIACTPEEENALLAAAALVDRHMQIISGKMKNMSRERMAVMAAINIAHELQQEETGGTTSASEYFDSDAAKRRIADMGARLDALVAAT